MPQPSPSSTLLVATDASAAWAQIEEAVRESSMMRCEGRAEQAAETMQTRLPPLIHVWSESSGLSAEDCRERLRQLFAKAQAQVAEAMFARRLVLASFRADPVSPMPVSDGRLALWREIPIDDIEGMLDALHESDRPRGRAAKRISRCPPSARTGLERPRETNEHDNSSSLNILSSP